MAATAAADELEGPGKAPRGVPLAVDELEALEERSDPDPLILSEAPGTPNGNLWDRRRVFWSVAEGGGLVRLDVVVVCKL